MIAFKGSEDAVEEEIVLGDDSDVGSWNRRCLVIVECSSICNRQLVSFPELPGRVFCTRWVFSSAHESAEFVGAPSPEW